MAKADIVNQCKKYIFLADLFVVQYTVVCFDHEQKNYRT